MLTFLHHLEKVAFLLKVQYKAQFAQYKAQILIKFAGWMNQVKINY